MAFADRAIEACDRVMASGNLSERQVRDVLKCENSNVQPLARHFGSENPMVRRAVARIIGKLGDVTPLVDAAMKEDDSSVLREMLLVLRGREEGVAWLERMVSSDDVFIREEVISMLRKSGNAESLLPLLFDRDDDLVRRIKRYIHEQEQEPENAGS